MEISKDKKDEERIVYKSIGITQTLSPDKDTKKRVYFSIHIGKKNQYLYMQSL